MIEENHQALRKALISTLLEFRKIKPTIHSICGLPAGEFFFLQRVHELSRNEGIRISHLRDSMSMTMPAVSQLVRILEEKGLVIRENAPKDRRVTLVTVTEKGEQVLRDSQEQFNQILNRLIERYGPEELEQLIQMLKRLSKTIRELKEELGISAVPEQLHFAGTFPISFAKEFHGKMFRDEELAFVYICACPTTCRIL